MGDIGDGTGTSYPGALDTDGTQESSTTDVRADVPNDQNSAIIALQTAVGTDPKGTAADVKTFIQAEHDTDGTHGAITPSTVTVSTVAPATPVINVLYKDTIVKVWVDFNGSGTIAINNDVNVSSLTDHGTGDYTVTFATDFAAANYASIITSGSNSHQLNTSAVGSQRFSTTNASGVNEDTGNVHMIIVGDQ